MLMTIHRPCGGRSHARCSSCSCSYSNSNAPSYHPLHARLRGGRQRGAELPASRSGGGSQSSSAVLFDRDTLPSFNMTPSLLRRQRGDGQSPEDGANGGYNFANRRLLLRTKRIVLLRHGQSEWNKEGRIQGDTNTSDLTPLGIVHAERCGRALSPIDFDVCFHSPLTRAAHTAQIIWNWSGSPDNGAGAFGGNGGSYRIGGEDGAGTPDIDAVARQPRDPGALIEIDELKEAHLYDLQGMTNEDAKRMFPEEFEKWRNNPSTLCMKGHYPVVELYVKAKEAWERIITDERYTDILIVSHKSMIRALLSTSLGET